MARPMGANTSLSAQAQSAPSEGLGQSTSRDDWGRPVSPWAPAPNLDNNNKVEGNKGSQHFNRCPQHNPAKFEGLIISILSFIRAPPDTKAGQAERDQEEKRWIHRLSSVVPRGLNLLD